jgi:hypothetical protein
MPKLSGIRNVKKSSGGLENLPGKLKNVLDFDRNLRRENMPNISRAKDLVKEWKAVWGLTKHDFKEVKWAGVEAKQAHELGWVKVMVMRQAKDDRVSEVGDDGGAANLGFGCFVAENFGERGLPVPLLARGRREFTESGLELYPIRYHGYRNDSEPTTRVRTLGDYLKRDWGWPSAYGKMVSHLPVYSLTAFIPDVSASGIGYSFMAGSLRGLIAHRIVGDRVLPWGYTEPSARFKVPPPMRLTDIEKYPGAEPRHCLFRAEDAPSLDRASAEAGSATAGRLIFILMQRPASRFDDPLPKDVSEGGEDRELFSIGEKDKKVPEKVRLGSAEDGEIVPDDQRLPLILDVNVCKVASGGINPQMVEQSARRIDFV